MTTMGITANNQNLQKLPPIQINKDKNAVIIVDDDASWDIAGLMLVGNCGIKDYFFAKNFSEAEQLIKEHGDRIAFAIVDGDLKDGYGQEGAANRVVQDLTANSIPFFRISAEPNKILNIGHGVIDKNRFGDGHNMLSLVQQNVQVESN